MKGSQALTPRLFSGAVTAMVLLMPDIAAAHLVTTGMGPVYDGIGHLLLTPEDLIPVIAVALYAGLRGREPGRYALFLFPLAWLLGGMVGIMTGSSPEFPLPILSFLLLGILIASDLRLPAPIMILLLTAVGIGHGYYNGIALGEGPGFPGLLGISATIFVLVALSAALVVSLQAHWTRIAVRVGGSWIAATGVLMLGWFARGSG